MHIQFPFCQYFWKDCPTSCLSFILKQDTGAIGVPVLMDRRGSFCQLLLQLQHQWRLSVACCWERTALLEYGGVGSSSENTFVHCRQCTALCNLKSNIRLPSCYIFNKSLGKCRNPIKAAALWLLGNFLPRNRAEGMSYIENKIWHFLCLTANCG